MHLATRAGLLLVPIVAAVSGGCSTLSRGTTQTVTFQTDSADATIYVGKQTLRAPAKVELSRKQAYTVLVTAPGRQSVQFEMKPKFDGISLGNLIYPGGSIGLLTDFLTGSDKKFAPLPTISLPHLDPSLPSQPTLVLLRQHKKQLMTSEEIRSMQTATSAEAAVSTIGPARDEGVALSGG
jgi:hypothetical protein